MQVLALVLLSLILILGPQWWVKRVLARYHRHEEDFPGTGGELARHLLDRYGLTQVRVEPSELPGLAIGARGGSRFIVSAPRHEKNRIVLPRISAWRSAVFTSK